MLIFIENTPRRYAWGSTLALPEMLGTPPTGEPQAELWLGTHPGSPAHVAKASPAPWTLIDLVESDPDRYGVAGGPLPFLLKVLAIGAPLSLQVHPDRTQAREGFAREDAAGIPRDAAERNYGDDNHKPELLVALSEVRALSGFRPLDEVRRELAAFMSIAPRGADALGRFSELLSGGADAELRRNALEWCFRSDDAVLALTALESAGREAGARDTPAIPEPRREALQELFTAHPGDRGILVSLLLHLVLLNPGEAIFLGARHPHAYLGGVAVELMAASDNVLRAGLTQKHVDIDELCRIIDTGELLSPLFPSTRLARGVDAWRPEIPDFQLFRARLREDDDSTDRVDDRIETAEQVEFDVPYPAVLMITAGRVRVERPAAEMDEVLSARRGQSIYVSSGEPIRLTGHGEVFLATVGTGYGS